MPPPTRHTYGIRAAVALCALLLCALCNTARAEAGTCLIEDVPFFSDDGQLCGPAVLYGVLAYYGRTVDFPALAADVYRPTLGGSLGIDLALRARREGFSATLSKGTEQEARGLLRQGKPLILQVARKGLFRTTHHFVLATGYTPRCIRVHSGPERDMLIPWPDFITMWDAAANLQLLVEPAP